MQNRRKVPEKTDDLFRRWNRVMAELQISATVPVVAFWCSGDSRLNFFLGLSPEEPWIPGEMKCNLISPLSPKLLRSKSSRRSPQPALAGTRLCFSGLHSCASVCNFPHVFLLRSWTIELSLVVTSLFLQFSPEDALGVVGAPRCCHTRIYSELCASTGCLCKTCTRFHQEVTRVIPLTSCDGSGAQKVPTTKTLQ